MARSLRGSRGRGRGRQNGAKVDDTRLVMQHKNVNFVLSPTDTPVAAQEPIRKQSPQNTESIYRPLSLHQHIRVLHLAPGAWDDPIKCSLRVETLENEALEYETLSYAWGDASERRIIICHGGGFTDTEFSITQSLFDALQHLRHCESDVLRGRTRKIWADAICINQEDLEERERQVGMMGRIYRRAKNQLIWLGPNENNAEVVDAFDYICRYALKEVRGNSKPIYYTNHGVSTFFLQRNSLRTADTMYSATAFALQQLFSRAVFQRGWVIQEVALSPSAEVLWGHGSIHLLWFSAAAWHLLTYWKWIFQDNPEAFSGLTNFDSMRLILEDQSNPQLSFLELMHRSRGFQFTDTRDRVYGLLGLRITDLSTILSDKFITPDYTLSKLGCFQKVAEEYLLHRQDPQILSAVQHHGYIDKQWPSWIPNWDIKVTNDIKRSGRLAYGGRYIANSYRKVTIDPSVTDDEGRKCLVFSGLAVDTIISVVHHTGEASSESYRTFFADLLQQATNYPGHHDKRWRKTMYENEIRLAWTATAGLQFDTGELLVRPRDEDMQVAGFRQFLTAKETAPQLPTFHEVGSERRLTIFDNAEPSDRFLARFEQVMWGRCLFWTRKGILGIGPEIMREGDRVVAILGCNVPLTLRHMEEELYRIVGECYIYDIMDGQGQAHRDGFGEKPQDFRIV